MIQKVLKSGPKKPKVLARTLCSALGISQG
jgi:hypothetical protein